MEIIQIIQDRHGSTLFGIANHIISLYRPILDNSPQFSGLMLLMQAWLSGKTPITILKVVGLIPTLVIVEIKNSQDNVVEAILGLSRLWEVEVP